MIDLAQYQIDGCGGDQRTNASIGLCCAFIDMATKPLYDTDTTGVDLDFMETAFRRPNDRS